MTSVRSTLSRTWRRSRAAVGGSAIVLTYHRVGDVTNDPHSLAVSVENFADQLRVIAKHYRALTARQLVSRVAAKRRLPHRAVVLTLDDGYAQTHATAASLLTAVGLRATSFLCSDAIGMAGEYPWDCTDPMLSARPSRRILTYTEVLELRAGKAIEFGSHTRSHPRLSQLDEAAQREEIIGGKQALDEMLGKRVELFAYPHGGPKDIDATSISLARAAGFMGAFTTRPGIVTPWSPLYELPRYHTENVSGDELRTLLDRWFASAR